MTNLSVLFAVMAASLLDPIALAGYVLAGIFIRDLWFALGASALWALAMVALVAILNPGYHPTGLTSAARILAGLLATGAVFGVAHMIRSRHR